MVSDSTPNPSKDDTGSDHWSLRFTPRAWHPYVRLLRLDRPIGIWLLLFPGWWSLTMAAPALDWVWGTHMALFAIGAVVMRGAGCAINDIADRDFDALVERTRSRPIASGQISRKQAALFLVVPLGIGLLVLWQFNPVARWVGVASLALVLPYPLMKRITHWPQAWLGLTFNWGALLGWAAATGRIDGAALAIYGAGIFWTLGYDTVYAHQDKEDDALAGVKSTALRLGDATPDWLKGFYSLTIGGLALAGILAPLSWPFFVVLLLAGGHLGWQAAAVRIDDAQNCLTVFRSNRWFGWLVLAAVLAGRF